MANSASASVYQCDYSEKRDFHRMTLNTSIEITLPDQGKTLGGFCLNLSSAGLMFRLQEPLSEGQTCNTIIESGSPTTSDLSATICVTRCIEESPSGYLIGAEIIQFH